MRFCVPSGNFGNLTAGVYAWQWGLPVEGFVAATNANDVVPEYLDTGKFHPRTSVRTLSNAMDVGDPSNFERLLAVFNRDPEAMRAVIHGERVTDEETRATMRRVYERHGLLLDPHTAVGVLAAERFRAASGFDGELLVLATAHPGKFSEIVREATGRGAPAARTAGRGPQAAQAEHPHPAALRAAEGAAPRALRRRLRGASARPSARPASIRLFTIPGCDRMNPRGW